MIEKQAQVGTLEITCDLPLVSRKCPALAVISVTALVSVQRQANWNRAKRKAGEKKGRAGFDQASVVPREGMG